uniref:Uncharacterized protein n=1 Tax=Arundo donax TaxID=35708 RepID=A0A0A8Y475_ARUDO
MSKAVCKLVTVVILTFTLGSLFFRILSSFFYKYLAHKREEFGWTS